MKTYKCGRGLGIMQDIRNKSEVIIELAGEWVSVCVSDAVSEGVGDRSGQIQPRAILVIISPSKNATSFPSEALFMISTSRKDRAR